MTGLILPSFKCHPGIWPAAFPQRPTEWALPKRCHSQMSFIPATINNAEVQHVRRVTPYVQNPSVRHEKARRYFQLDIHGPLAMQRVFCILDNYPWWNCSTHPPVQKKKKSSRCVRSQTLADASAECAETTPSSNINRQWIWPGKKKTDATSSSIFLMLTHGYMIERQKYIR